MGTVRFLLNGKPRIENGLPAATTVLDWLRGPARLTGTKEGCAEGDCGACTVVLARQRDGARASFEAVNSCILTMAQIDGAALVTVEGLTATNGAPHAVQQALAEGDGTQCGFCTPGFAMTMFALQQGGEPARDDLIHDALAGNLCRCTGYRPIVEACRQVMARDGARPDLCSRLDEVQPPSGMPAEGFAVPTSLDELLRRKAERPDAVLLGGGTDLGLLPSKQRRVPDFLLSTAQVPELRAIAVAGGSLQIGAAATYTVALPEIDKYWPAFGALIRRIGSRQIRNLGTIGGNLGTASPIGDTLPCLMALDAMLVLRSVRGAREVAVQDFFTGYRRTVLTADEIIEAIRLPLPQAGGSFFAWKVSKRVDQDISTLLGAFHLTRHDGKTVGIRASFGGMAAVPARAPAVEALLRGTDFSDTAIASAIARDFTPLGDHRASADYRLRAAAGLVRRLLLEMNGQPAPALESL